MKKTAVVRFGVREHLRIEVEYEDDSQEDNLDLARRAVQQAIQEQPLFPWELDEQEEFTIDFENGEDEIYVEL